MKQKLLVQRTKSSKENSFRNEGIFDVFYDDKGKDVALQYSPLDESWTCPGKNAAKLHCDGNGLNLSLAGAVGSEHKKVYLDYSQADYAFQLLKIHYKLYHRSRTELITKNVFVNKLSELDAPKETVQKKSGKAPLRPMGDVISDLEAVVQEMVGSHDLQWGDILNLVHGYLRVHNPEAQEEYTTGGNPEFYYGPKDE